MDARNQASDLEYVHPLVGHKICRSGRPQLPDTEQPLARRSGGYGVLFLLSALRSGGSACQSCFGVRAHVIPPAIHQKKSWALTLRDQMPFTADSACHVRGPPSRATATEHTNEISRST
jgi:hypothetical protein